MTRAQARFWCWTVKCACRRTRAELALLGSGDFFGEIALAAPGTPYRRRQGGNHVRRLVYFLKQDLEEWLEHEPRLGAKFLLNLSATLAQRLFEANQADCQTSMSWQQSPHIQTFRLFALVVAVCLASFYLIASVLVPVIISFTLYALFQPAVNYLGASRHQPFAVDI